MALLNSRKFVGVDVSQRYCEIAVKRLVAVSKELPLFSAVQALDSKD
jgi:hypothetical protein